MDHGIRFLELSRAFQQPYRFYSVLLEEFELKLEQLVSRISLSLYTTGAKPDMQHDKAPSNNQERN